MSASNGGQYVIGVDIGGTFTDCVVLGDSGDPVIAKAPSTPPEFEDGFIDSVRAAADQMGMSLEDLLGGAKGVHHGSTVGTNALVEGRTARVGLLTTAGHADTTFVMQAGARLMGLEPRYVSNVAAQSKPQPIVPKSLVREVDERIAFDGNAVVDLDEEACRREIESLLEEGVEAIAISFLWATANNAHERRVAEIVAELSPETFVSVSSDVVPRLGEYQRTVAAVINALIGPVTRAYLTKLGERLTACGYDGTLHIMSCTGGLTDADYVRELPLLTIGSGPVAGLIGAGGLARGSGQNGRDGGMSGLNVITADMGGTTFDVGVVRRGEPVTRATTRYGQYEYFVPTLDVRSVGAGGGSIVHFDDEIGNLRVGPRSAGAIPGPASYLRGGEEATVTDADLVLGYVNPTDFLGGDAERSMEAARAALARAGEPLGFSAEETAMAAARIVDNQMADAIRLASVHQGYDPRDYVMYAYGGAGPVHCPTLAPFLGIRKIVIPLGDLASGWSAFGIAGADALLVEESMVVLNAPFDIDRMNSVWDELEATVSAKLVSQGVAAGDVSLERSIDMKYSLQVNEVRIPAPAGRYDAAARETLIATFEAEYERLYGKDSGYAAAGFSLTLMRVSARATLTDHELRRDGAAAGSEQAEPTGERDVIWYDRGAEPLATPVYAGEGLAGGARVDGPAIVEFPDTTLVLRHEQVASIDPLGSIVVESP